MNAPAATHDAVSSETRIKIASLRVEFGRRSAENLEMNEGRKPYTGGCLCGTLRYEAVGGLARTLAPRAALAGRDAP
jgi:hypothetical protein